MDQPVPQVSDQDVERIVRRDFATRDVAAALALLAEYGRQDWHREVPRVRLAMLRLANGKLDKLRDAARTADQDYRDILAGAEYPGYFAKVNPAETDDAKRLAIIDADWQQYRRWLERE